MEVSTGSAKDHLITATKLLDKKQSLEDIAVEEQKELRQVKTRVTEALRFKDRQVKKAKEEVQE